ncbi:MAG TPA: efflux transporter outer membrane subunit, partial [Blastocatellia bacterium]|nr:efflux transporter outer membrane subunit [Blastocatellia bacterium]
MRTRCIVVVLALAVCAGGCKLGPNYKRPQVEVPPDYRAGDVNPQPNPASIADLKWFDLFQDPALQELVKEALQNNFDLRIASARVLEARARYGIVKADQFPTVNGNASFTAQRASTVGALNIPGAPSSADASFTTVGFSLSWELDIWGRIRRLKESERALYFAAEDTQRAVIVTLIADVASNYFRLLELDSELAIANSTLVTRQEGLRLTTARRDRGVTSSIDVRQAEDLLYTVQTQIADIERAIEQSENEISFLVGRVPGPIKRGQPFISQSFPSVVPEGLPSSLLERRPDVLAAEQQLVAANAQIGAAKALYFPQISLTGFLGGESRALSNIFTAPARSQFISPSVVQQIFNAGRIRSNVRFTEAQKVEFVAAYEQSVSNGFREVSNSLIEHTKSREAREQQEKA